MTVPPTQAPVVVGVEATATSRPVAGSRTAIRVAAREASYRDTALIAFMAYTGNPMLGAAAVRPISTVRTAADERSVAETTLREAVADALGDQASWVRLHLAAGLPGRNLVSAAYQVGAELIVVAGRRSPAALTGGLSQYLLRRAPCPVLVVP